MTTSTLNEFSAFAENLAKEAGQIIRPYFRKSIAIERKTDDSPVTIADKKAEEHMRAKIVKAFPDHGIIGEEFGNTNESAEFKWILDPIDGTKSFICGAQSFGTLIALTQNDSPVLGVFYQPILDELLVGDNFTTKLNGQTSMVRQCTEIEEAVLLTTDHLNVHKYQNDNGFNALVADVRLYRNWGDCYGYYLLCSGFADIMIDPIMNIWDMAALLPIIKGAGGAFASYSGGDPLKDNSLVASNPVLLPKVLTILNSETK